MPSSAEYIVQLCILGSADLTLSWFQISHKSVGISNYWLLGNDPLALEKKNLQRKKGVDAPIIPEKKQEGLFYPKEYK